MKKLALHGIGGGRQEATFELEELYITLRTISKIKLSEEEQHALIAEAAEMLPGEEARLKERFDIEQMTTVSVNRALAERRQLVILGDPGSGKSTLLKYLATVYGRALRDQIPLVKERFDLDEEGLLPVFLELSKLGGWLSRTAPESDQKDGPDSLINTWLETLPDGIGMSRAFIEPYLKAGQAVFLLDGLDEVANPELRRRVARIVEGVARFYGDCRYLVSSRIAGFIGPAVVRGRIPSGDRTSHLQKPISKTFYSTGTGSSPAATAQKGKRRPPLAQTETAKLINAMADKPHIRELAINPLLLTVIALVHRTKALPDRRAELYKEAVEVLIHKWDAGHGLRPREIAGHRIDANKIRIILQAVALHMHEKNRGGQREIDYDDLKAILAEQFRKMYGTEVDIDLMVDGFINLIEERAGLLIARENRSRYAFSHLTFQEYMTAGAVADLDGDHFRYTLERIGDSWWREVILLTAGYLSDGGWAR